MTEVSKAGTLRVGIAGLGTVGMGVARLLVEHQKELALRVGRSIAITAITARDQKKNRGLDFPSAKWLADAVAVATSPDVDVFVELIGGEEGPAHAAVEAALKAGKPVVTANKALLAHHGMALAALAEKQGVALKFEAAVAGGIPVVKALRESLASNRISRISGILNGTCNYILSAMQAEGRAFGDVLAEAQAKGYAEADPTFDIGGHDTAHKLVILTSLAFGTKLSLKDVYIEGIEGIRAADIEAAEDLGYRIKLLGVAQRTETGIEQRVHPTMVPVGSAIAAVNGVTNCVAIDADYVGALTLVGPGAGAKATASSVVADLIDIARGDVSPPFIVPAAKLEPYKKAQLKAHAGGYYVRLSVFDKPGAFAAITARMAERQVSLESIVQRKPRDRKLDPAAKPGAGAAVQVIMITHETTEAAIRSALEKIESDGFVNEKPQMIRIESV
jgi:homoserine dehydrogenase